MRTTAPPPNALASTSNHDFSGSIVRDGDALVIAFSGSADFEALDGTKQLLGELGAIAAKQVPAKVTVDLRGLEFMNSSCLKGFLGWIAQVQDLAPEQQYRITFLSNPAYHWQRRSLEALRCFATDLIDIVVMAG